MRSFLLNKLVRTKIAASMEQLGQTVTYRHLDDAQFKQALIDKLREEVAEIKLDNSADSLNEMADVLEALESLAQQTGSSLDDLRKLQLQRREERGGLNKDHYVERLDLADDDEWVEYYAKEPERFREIV